MCSRGDGLTKKKMLYYRVADTSNRWLPSSTRASSRSLLLLCLQLLAFAAACVVLRGLMGTVTACPAADSTSMGVLLLAPALMPLPLHQFCLSRLIRAALCATALGGE